MLGKTLIATFMCALGVAVASNSPVFLWGANSPSKPALHTVSEKEFAELAAPLLKDSMIVAFLEENLSSNDFLCSNADSASCYAHLQGVSPKTYYTNVENPIEALRSVAAEREFNNVDKSGNLATPLECAAGKVVFVNFDSQSGVRADELEAHDAAISAISHDVSCPVVYMYMSTAQTSPAPRRVRRDTAATTGGYMFRSGSQFLLFFTKLMITTSLGTEELIVSDMQITNSTTADNTQFSVSLAVGAKPLTFDISLSAGYFTMSNVAYDGTTYRVLGVDAPTDFSYFCGNLTLNAISESTTETNTNVLQWNSLQFQAPFGSTEDPNFVFGDAWHCVGFVTPGILSGLFVVVIMLLIVFTGICWMMDINTMDRFDDPKGKTITINATD